MIGWIMDNMPLFISVLSLTVSVITAVIIICRLRASDKRSTRIGKVLLNRMQTLDDSRAASFSVLSDSIGSSLNSAEMRLNASSEELKRASADTAALSHEIRENSLKEQLAVRQLIEERLNGIRESNDAKLLEIENKVDEKLQKTLESRIGESFRQVSDQLERVYKSIGEMQALAVNVGDLKRVLQNVTVRGAWGEARLESILRDNLAAGQYAENISVQPNSSERVEFAVILPGREDGAVYLPIDSKFPQAEYERLTAAFEVGDKNALASSRALLAQAVMTEGKRISSKYVKPPYTTDFAVMFLPTEGLFSEVVSRPGLTDELQRKYRVIPAGPTTLTALITSLQIGFRTLAVEQRSLEVWRLLGQVRTEFNAFGASIDAARKRLEQASGELDTASSRTRAINRRLADADRIDIAPEPHEDGIQ